MKSIQSFDGYSGNIIIIKSKSPMRRCDIAFTRIVQNGKALLARQSFERLLAVTGSI